MSVLRDADDEDAVAGSQAKDERREEDALLERCGLNEGRRAEDRAMERWDGSDGLGIALDALSGRFGRIQAPIGLRDAAAAAGSKKGRAQKRLSQSYFGNNYRLSGAW